MGTHGLCFVLKRKTDGCARIACRLQGENGQAHRIVSHLEEANGWVRTDCVSP